MRGVARARPQQFGVSINEGSCSELSQNFCLVLIEGALEFLLLDQEFVLSKPQHVRPVVSQPFGALAASHVDRAAGRNRKQNNVFDCELQANAELE